MTGGFNLPRRQFLQLSAAGAFPVVSSALHATDVIDVRGFGAKGDGLTLNTRARQRAIDFASGAGGGVVSLPAGVFLTGGLVLLSHLTLHLGAGAVLRGSPNVDDYDYHPGPPMEGDANGRHLLFAQDAEDIAITGFGSIDGNGAFFWHRKGRPTPRLEDLWADVIAWDYEAATPRRPSPMLEFVRCHNIHIEGVTLTNAPGWTLRLIACESVFIRGIRVRSPIFAPNTDGMDITACRNVFVSDCDIATGDDAICIKSENPYGDLLPTKNITVTNCVLSTCCNGFKVGTATHGLVENIVFSNSVISNDDSAPLNHRATSGIALEIVDGGTMHGIAISNIRMENARTPLFIRLGRRTPEAGSSFATFVSMAFTLQVLSSPVPSLACPICVLKTSLSRIPAFRLKSTASWKGRTTLSRSRHPSIPKPACLAACLLPVSMSVMLAAYVSAASNSSAVA